MLSHTCCRPVSSEMLSLRADLEECDVQTIETVRIFFHFTLILSCLLLQGYGDRDIV